MQFAQFSKQVKVIHPHSLHLEIQLQVWERLYVSPPS